VLLPSGLLMYSLLFCFSSRLLLLSLLGQIPAQTGTERWKSSLEPGKLNVIETETLYVGMI